MIGSGQVNGWWCGVGYDRRTRVFVVCTAFSRFISTDREHSTRGIHPSTKHQAAGQPPPRPFAPIGWRWTARWATGCAPAVSRVLPIFRCLLQQLL